MDNEIIKTKKCVRCGKEKPLSEFHAYRISPDGLKSRCKKCKRNYDKERYLINKKEMILKVHEWQIMHPDLRKKYKRNCYYRRKEKEKNVGQSQ